MKLRYHLIAFAGILVCSCSNRKAELPEKGSSTEVKAFNAYEAENYEKAIFYFDQLIKNDSLNGRYYYARGSSNGRSGKFDQATKDYLNSARHGYMKCASYFNAGLANTYVKDSLALIYFKESADLFDGKEPGLSKEVILKKYEECLIRLKK